MKILASSDLHYNIPRSKQPTRLLAKKINATNADILILAGDIAGADTTAFTEALELFSDFKGIKLLVPGNHDLWTNNGTNSLEKWKNTLPELAKQYEFIMLDGNPQIIDNIGFVGNVGWYDYSFRDETLNVPITFYKAKIGPGRALYNGNLTTDFKITPDKLTHTHIAITAQWNDRKFVKLPLTDEQFTELLTNMLRNDIEKISSKCKKIIAITHHLPARELVWYRGHPNWDFSAAFLGSKKFAETLTPYDNIIYHLSGHNHKAAKCKIANTQHITIGSTYKHKQLIELNI